MLDRFVEGLSQLDITLSATVIKKEIKFIDEMLHWNKRINLTSIRNGEEAIEKHLLDSLLLLSHLKESRRMMDMGSGGGLPGIPLAIAIPTLQVVSVDSVGKKINFQKHIKRLLQLDNLTILQSRIENLERETDKYQKYDVVVARAFTSLDVLLEYATPWLVPGGRLIAMKGPGGEDELQTLTQKMAGGHLSKPNIYTYHLPFTQVERQIIIIENR